MTKLKSPQQLHAEREEARRYLLGNFTLPIDKLLLVYARQSSKQQVVNNVQSALQQTDDLLLRGLDLGWKRDDMVLFIENQFTKDGKRTDKIRSVSGTIPIDDRAGIKTIMDEYVRTGKGGAIICYDVSRLTRDADLQDAIDLAKACRENHVIIITNETVFDFNNPTREDYNRFLDEAKEAAAFINKHIKGKMLKARTRKAEIEGKLGNGVAPIGLMSDKKPGDRAGNSFLPSPHAPYVEKLYRRFHELHGNFAGLFREIVGTVVFPDLPGVNPNTITLTRIEGGWTIIRRNTLKYILTNIQYDGHLVFNGKIVKHNAHTAIVAHDLWQYAFDRLSNVDIEGNPIEKPRRAVRFNQRGNTTDALLAGTRHDGRPVIDGTGEYHVYVYAPQRNWSAAYRLKRTRGLEIQTQPVGINTKKLDQIIIERLMARLESRHVERNACNWHMLDTLKKPKEEESQPVKTELEKTIEEAQKKLAQITRRIDVAQDLMSNAELREAYTSKYNLTKLIQELEDRKKRQEAILAEIEQAKEDCETAWCEWNKWKLERRRGFIRTVTQSITLEKIAEGWIKLTIIWCPFLDDIADKVDVALIRQEGGGQWTDEEKALLKEHYLTATQGELLRLFPTRSWLSIRSKGSELKVGRSKNILYDTDTPRDISLIDREIIDHYDLKLDGKPYWWISEANVIGDCQS
jgi:hypothetical protein